MESHTLKNDNTEISIYTKGAELFSYKINGEELIWDRDPKFWEGSSPILFPFVGMLKDKKYTYNNEEYNIITRHGYARNSEFELVEKTEKLLKFKLSSNEETLKIYPFEYDLFITYKIVENDLEIFYEVVNKTNGEMYFSIGAHPAFSIKINENIKMEDYYLEFNKKETIDKLKLEDGYVLDEKENGLNEENIINLYENIFEEDAIVFENTKSTEVSLKCKKHNKSIKVNYKGFPYIAFWNKPGAPYICIEPWYGITDYKNHDYKIENKKGIIKLEKNEKFLAKLTIKMGN